VQSLIREMLRPNPVVMAVLVTATHANEAARRG